MSSHQRTGHEKETGLFLGQQVLPEQVCQTQDAWQSRRMALSVESPRLPRLAHASQLARTHLLVLF